MGALIALACIGSGVQPEGADGACPNEERRVEQGSAALALPDCRAYELVSPGSLVRQNLQKGARTSPDGDAFTYHSTFPATDAETSGYFHLATRGTDGWSVRGVGPQRAPGARFEELCDSNVYFSADLRLNIDEEGWFDGEGEARCKRVEGSLVPGEPHPWRNVFLHDPASGAYQLLNLTPPEAEPANAKFQDASEDFSRILFSVEARLTADAPSANNLYLWEAGALRLVPHLPDGTPASGELVEGAGYETRAGVEVQGSGLAPIVGAVSRDGRRVFFHSGGGLYLRLNADMPQSPIESGECTDPQLACTVQVDATQGPGASGAGVFWRADEEAQSVLLTSERKLTADSTATSGKADLYRYDLPSAELTDLTPNPSEAADVRGVAGSSEDGSRVYFVANGVLAPGGAPGNCRGAKASGQTCNLYLAQGGSISFIATLSREDRNTWQEAESASAIPTRKQRAVWANPSPSGRYFAFASVRSLTGYDNRDATDGKPNRQVFLYDAEADELRCASCIPDGSRPEDPAVKVALEAAYGHNTPGGSAKWKVNALLEDGSLFFHTEDPLLEADANARLDVYRYRDGQHRLISPGDFPGDAFFYDATPDGSDVFFRTPQALVGSDTDNQNASVYDARVGGGFPAPPPPAPCEGEDCRDAPPQVPLPSLPATSVFQGPGNPKKGARPRKAGSCRAKGRRAAKRNRCARRAARRGHAKRRAGR